jgi:DNA-binding CsgD family transcriptional regulator
VDGSGGRAPFVGRAEELGRLGEVVAAVAGGQPRTVRIGGEAGVGKTRLLAEVQAGAAAAGALVLAGGCIPVGDGALPFACFSQALRRLSRVLDSDALDEVVGPWRSDLARIVPGLGEPAGAEQSPARLFELLLGLLERLAARSPVVLVLEDLHWADQSTVDLLRFLVAGLRDGAIGLVGTYRSDELDRRHPLWLLLVELSRDPAVERLELARFGREDLAELLAGILGTPPPTPLLARVLDRSDGNPLFAEELLAAEQRGGGLPGTLQELLLARIEALPAAAQQAVRVAAVAGRQVRHQLLAAACGLPEPALLAALREAVARQVLAAAEDGYAFRHALLQEVTYADLLPGERSQLHRTLATVLAAEPGLAGGTPTETAAELATHWYHSHDLARALPALVDAGLAAARAAAFAEALRHFERALDLWDQLPEVAATLPLDQAGLLEQAAKAADLAGSPQRAVALVRRALDRLDPAAGPVRRGLLTAALARYLWTSGESHALDVFAQAVQLIPAEPPSPERAWVLARHAQALVLASRPRDAHARAAEALDVATRVGAVREAGWAHTFLAATLLTVGGDVQQALAHGDAARRAAEETGDVELLAMTVTFSPQVLEAAGRVEEALALVVDGIAALRGRGLDRHARAFLCGLASYLAFRLGRWTEAERYSQEALDTAGQGVSRLHALLWRARLELGTGEEDAAAARLEEVRRRLGTEPPLQFACRLAEVGGQLALAQGRPADARTAVAEGLAQVEGSEDEEELRGLLVVGMRAEADLATAPGARAAGDAEASRASGILAARRRGAELLALLDRLLQGSDRPEPSTLACAALVRAEHTRLEGRPDPARWEEAAARYDDLGDGYAAAYARWRQAEALLAGRGSRPAAARTLRAAHQAAARLGAGPLARETELLAKRARLDLTEREAHAKAQAPANRFGLTAREHEVLVLLAEGRTNPQIAGALFISPKTVGIHVSNILAKLGVTGRVEAATVAQRAGMLGPPAS